MALAVQDPFGTWFSGPFGCWLSPSRFTSWPSGWEALCSRRDSVDIIEWQHPHSGCKASIVLPKPLVTYTPQELWDGCGPFSRVIQQEDRK